MKSVYKKLSAIQASLVIGKDKKNTFAKFNFRNIEGIMAAVKPYLKEHGCVILLDNDLEIISEKIFRKSVARFICAETSEEIKVHTYTQETLEKKGCSPEQCSGTTSSYGDKYCLGKLLCISDATEDPDGKDNSSKDSAVDYKKRSSQISEIKALLSEKTKGLTTKDKGFFMAQTTGAKTFDAFSKMSNGMLDAIINKIKNTQSEIEMPEV
jgi:hypothetical protein